MTIRDDRATGPARRPSVVVVTLLPVPFPGAPRHGAAARGGVGAS